MDNVVNNKMDKSDIFTLMQLGKPYKSYIKAVLGGVYVTVWDTFTNTQVGKIIIGDPKSPKDKDNIIIDVWSEAEDAFFKKANKIHLETAYIIPYTRKDAPQEKESSPNDFTDEDITALLKSPFLSLQSKVNKMTSLAPLFRMLTIAKELEKSDKIIKFIESKISEIQAAEYPAPQESVTLEL